MEIRHPRHFRVLAFAPSSRGFGFAVLEGAEKLVDWGVKSIAGDKNAASIAKMEELIILYEPGVIVLEDAAAKHSRRSPRVRDLARSVIAIAGRKGIKTATYSQKQIRETFFVHDEGTKHALAEILAARFPEELESRLPPKRQPWMSVDYRMDIFDAVALAVTFRSKNRYKS